MILLSFEVPDEEFKRAYNALQHIHGGAPKAIMRALNHAAYKARKEAVEAVCANYAVKPAEVRRTMVIKRATPNNLLCEIISEGSPRPLIKFNVNPKKPPVQSGKRISQRKKIVAGVKFGVQKALPFAFIAKLDNGHIGVFSRKGGKSLPIKQRYSLSIPQAFGNDSIREFLLGQAIMNFSVELDRQIDLILGGGK